MKRHLKFEVMNQVSTLNRITSAFVRLQYNIEELHVKKRDDNPNISDMELIVNIEDEDVLNILLNKLQQQINVLNVEQYSA
ncbi:ACT domain-containing protein [Staphylococcus warneri]|jgi:acetolactate synthase-1/3 small subunit|uniref:ACT domain-containing protein n=1 Tax=Staphylococcus warneri TaxID=1292 RepID=A0A2T4PYT3_STAWA|nr:MULTISPECIES: ACT domain-containing protein [Staphylococcus]MBE9430238.1 ACT domain-containing protein [Staphylococcus epidermidis]MBJ7884250.1 ACT domain-containing protein [Bacillaceae bacterium HSR45]MBY6181171.1 ACT domain-containing protein [Staphylococcaceae bacterium DP2N0-1]QAV32231.1 acetolactate synthase 1 regulatory subunit [Sulfitobacter donghicola]COP73568.1 acetolactate synthase 3 regulatory subunit [Streptococcus pneumoniae]SKR83681.1 acetolactate synthase 1 regulatory subun